MLLPRPWTGLGVSTVAQDIIRRYIERSLARMTALYSAGTGAEFAHPNDVVKAHTMDFRASVSYPAKSRSEDWLRIGQISCEHGGVRKLETLSHVQMSNIV